MPEGTPTLTDSRPDKATPRRMPAWIRQNLGDHSHYGRTARAVHDNRLTTVCEEARCPNRGECWSHGTATFMLLGDTCTRACGFCAVKTGRPSAIDTDEPRRVAQAVQGMALRYVVLTSVNRDDLPDGGAGIYAQTLRRLRRAMPALGLEILTPDFRGCQEQAIATISGVFEPVTADRPQLVWGHNVETVPRLYKEARKGASYQRSLRLLEQTARLPGIEAKSALMLGLGEQRDEVLQVLRELRQAGVSRIALGQYLRPGRQYLPVKEYLHPTVYADYAAQARAMGYTWVKSGPMVRSSYHAEQQQA